MRDLFICHASEDKEKIVLPLAAALDQENISYWLDKAEIGVGDSIPGKINQGLPDCRYILAVLSLAFIGKPFANEELNAAIHQQASSGEVKVLPVLVGTAQDHKRILEKLPLLNHRNCLEWDGNPRAMVRKLLPSLRPGGRSVAQVCFVSSEYPPHTQGGLGIHVEKLTTALAGHVDLDVVLPNPGNDGYQSLAPQVRPVPLADVDASYGEPISWLRFAEFAAERISRMARVPEVIHCHDWVTVLAGIKCRWLLNVPLVFHLHLPNRNPFCASVENLGLVCADLVTVNSEAMFVALRDRRLPIRRLEIVKNGVDADMFRPADDWPADDGYILFAGRLVEQKGVDYLLRAIYYVKGKFPGVRVKIVGDGEYRPWLEQLSANLMLSREVEFLGWRDQRELVTLYQRALAVAIPSVFEPFGMVALEALACQRPVVASNTGGLKEIVQHGVTGYLAEPKDDLGLAQWLMTILYNADLRHRLGKAGGEYVRNEAYAWPSIAQRFVALYDELQRSPRDRTVPESAEEFRRQIADLACEISPDYEPGEFLDRLFVG